MHKKINKMKICIKIFTCTKIFAKKTKKYLKYA